MTQSHDIDKEKNPQYAYWPVLRQNNTIFVPIHHHSESKKCKPTLYSMEDIIDYNESYAPKLLTWITTNASANKKEDKIILQKLDELKISTQCVSFVFVLFMCLGIQSVVHRVTNVL